jgi:hypothetical protein
MKTNFADGAVQSPVLVASTTCPALYNMKLDGVVL